MEHHELLLTVCLKFVLLFVVLKAEEQSGEWWALNVHVCAFIYYLLEYKMNIKYELSSMHIDSPHSL